VHRFFIGVVVGLLVGVLLTIRISSWFSPSESYDSVDRFEVLAVIKDPGSNESAVIVKYQHGNSSSGGTAVWIVRTTAPAVGSTEPLMGPPALVSTEAFSVQQVSWRPNHRVLLTLKGPVGFSADDHYCFWEASTVQTICLEGSGVDVVVEP
jgi:hypothetical protein